MDPNAAYRMMTEHFAAGEYLEAWDVADGLLSWTLRGGFLPGDERDRKSVVLACRAMMEACDTLYGKAA